MNHGLLKIDLERDVNEILKLINSYMKRTYVRDIQKELLRLKAEKEGHLSEELQLLYALKPFIPEKNRTQYNEICKLIMYTQITEAIMPRIIPYLGRNNREEQDPVKMIIAKLLMYKIMYDLEKS